MTTNTGQNFRNAIRRTTTEPWRILHCHHRGQAPVYAPRGLEKLGRLNLTEGALKPRLDTG